MDGQTPPILSVMSERSTLYEGRAEKNRGVRRLGWSRGCHVRMFQMFKKRKCCVRCQVTIVLIFYAVIYWVLAQKTINLKFSVVQTKGRRGD